MRESSKVLRPFSKRTRQETGKSIAVGERDDHLEKEKNVKKI